MGTFSALITGAGEIVTLAINSVGTIAEASFVVFVPVSLAIMKQVTSTGKSFFFYRRGRGRR